MLAQARECHENAVAVAIFPELCLTGYAIDDLLLQDALLDAAHDALDDVALGTADLLPLLVVGAPAGARHPGPQLRGGDPPAAGSSGSRRSPTCRPTASSTSAGTSRPETTGAATPSRSAETEVPFGPGPDLRRPPTCPDLKLHVEICEDMWVPVPPSAEASLAGATVLANLSGSPITVARAEDRRLLVRSASARCNAAYVFAAAGPGESTTDLSWDGQTMIYESGDLIAEGPRFPEGAACAVADIDLDRLRQDRLRQGTHDDNRRTHAERVAAFRTVGFELDPPTGDIGLRRKVDRFPFVPDDPDRLALDCYEAYNIQVSGLEQRLTAIGQPKAIIGVSGGLDSTHALIVSAKAMDRLGRPRSDIHAFTMPGFATGETTKSYATQLAKSLGVTFEELDIRPAAKQLLTDIDHPFAGGEPVYDVTFENVQAGLRYDYLFRLANHRGGIVVGTGDLSELALGWCTYGVGDQMSHYNVNAGVPKTLVQHLIRWVAESDQFDADTNELLEEILQQEITPELIPTTDGAKPQATEDTVGPYALQDFTLFNVLRRGMRPSRIAFLAWHAWHDESAGDWPPGFPEERRTSYDLATIRKWMAVFITRFFASQFKRSALPNGPKVSAGGTMSPRGDWRMPSDAHPTAWLADLDDVPKA